MARRSKITPTHVLITGASSGIGAALALLYASPGIRLSLHGRNSDRLALVARAAEERGATLTTNIGDVTDVEEMALWIKTCDREQPLDLVIANAGISAGSGGSRESEQQSREIFATNVTGVLNTVHPAISLMLSRRQGQIAIMSSLAGFSGFGGAPAYSASKAAVRVYGEALRAELMPAGIWVNVICPGFIKTPMTDVNPFPMPFIMGPGRAAEIIRQGLEQNQARIAFPFPMYAIVRSLAALPTTWVDKGMGWVPKKPARE